MWWTSPYWFHFARFLAFKQLGGCLKQNLKYANIFRMVSYFQVTSVKIMFERVKITNFWTDICRVLFSTNLAEWNFTFETSKNVFRVLIAIEVKAFWLLIKVERAWRMGLWFDQNNLFWRVILHAFNLLNKDLFVEFIQNSKFL